MPYPHVIQRFALVLCLIALVQAPSVVRADDRLFEFRMGKPYGEAEGLTPLA